MSKKFQMLFGLLMIFSMILSACGAPAAEPVVETEAPVVVTEAPVVETGPDAQALFTDLVATLTPDNGFGSVSAAKLSEELVEKPPFLLDVREVSEVEADGYIEGAINIPVREVLNNLDKLPGLDEPIVVYCASGHRGSMVMASLKLLGYTSVRNLGGGTGAWKKASLPLVAGVPEAPAVINSAAIVEDKALFDMLNGFLSGLPEGYYTVKADKLAEELVDAAPVLIDVRTTADWDKDGYIEGAINIPFNDFFTSLDKLPAKDANVVVYCASGHRGAMIMMAMRLMGYENVRNLGGGLGAWKTANLPVVGGQPTLNAMYSTMLSTMTGYNALKPEDLLVEMTEDTPPFLLDVRSVEEVQESGHIEGATNIPLNELTQHLDLLPSFDTPIVTYCGTGWRCTIAMTALHGMGWKNVRALKVAFADWVAAGNPVVAGVPEPMVLNAAQPAANLVAAVEPALAALKEKGWGGITADDLNTALVEKPNLIIIDVRTPEEIAEKGIIKLEGQQLLVIPLADFVANASQWPADKNAEIVVYCGSGHRSTIAMTILLTNGYTNVLSLKGGFGAWVEAGLPTAEYVAP
ncbi:MAG: rhodanese-like domain-containing protein [Chloroflexota bacterium]